MWFLGVDGNGDGDGDGVVGMLQHVLPPSLFTLPVNTSLLHKAKL